MALRHSADETFTWLTQGLLPSTLCRHSMVKGARPAAGDVGTRTVRRDTGAQ